MPKVRRATVDDAIAIATLHIASWRVTYRGVMSDALLDGLDLEERAAQRARFIQEAGDGPRHNVVSCDGEVVRAWASWGPERVEEGQPPSDALELYAIYAHPDAVGRGHGRALICHVLDEARSAGASAMTLWYQSQNNHAARFYERAGFVPDGATPESPCTMPDGTDTGALKRKLRITL